MKERSRVDQAWKSDNVDTSQDENTPRPWNGSHGKPCATLRLVFADGSRQGLSYSDFKGYQLSGDMLKIYFTTATVVCVGRYLEALADLVEEKPRATSAPSTRAPSRCQSTKALSSASNCSRPIPMPSRASHSMTHRYLCGSVQWLYRHP